MLINILIIEFLFITLLPNFLELKRSETPEFKLIRHLVWSLRRGSDISPTSVEMVRYVRINVKKSNRMYNLFNFK